MTIQIKPLWQHLTGSTYCTLSLIFQKIDLRFFIEVIIIKLFLKNINPFAPGDFAEKRVLKLVEWFSGHCHAIKS